MKSKRKKKTSTIERKKKKKGQTKPTTNGKATQATINRQE